MFAMVSVLVSVVSVALRVMCMSMIMGRRVRMIMGVFVLMRVMMMIVIMSVGVRMTTTLTS
jgi:hypothetical protein